MSDPQQTETNNTLLMKMNVGKTGFLEERKKNTALTQAYTTLKEEFSSKEEELLKIKEQGASKEEEFNKTKEQLVLKEENYNKGKEKLGEFKDTSGKQQLKKFFTGFLGETPNVVAEIEAKPKEVDSINYQKLNEEGTEQGMTLQKDINVKDEKLQEATAACDKMREECDSKIKEIENKYSNLIEEKKAEIDQENHELLDDLYRQIKEKDKTINETHERMVNMSDLFKNYDIKYISLEEQVKEYKTKYEVKSKEATQLLNGQIRLLEKIDDLQTEVEDLRLQGDAFKSTIHDLIPIEMNYIFNGIIGSVSTGKDNVFTTKINKKLELCFGKVKHSLYFKQDDEKEKIFTNKEIITIVGDKTTRERLMISGNISGERKNYLCVFKAKEIEYIIRFYTQIKYKPNFVDNALMKVSMGDYGY